MAAGIRRIALPASEYQLDEDGWIDVRSRITAGMALAISAALPDTDAATVAGLKAYIVGWSLKFDGEAMPNSSENVLNLPLEVFSLVAKELEKFPLAGGGSPKP